MAIEHFSFPRFLAKFFAEPKFLLGRCGSLLSIWLRCRLTS
jgi:hypothetical protein